MKEIQLTQGFVALVDDEDYERVSKFKWRVRVDKKRGYIYVEMGSYHADTLWQMADYIMGPPKTGFMWDHKDRNTLNQQKSNLRLATPSQNTVNRALSKRNTSGFRGVHYVMTQRAPYVWKATITKDGKTTHLGYYKTKEEAARAYDKKAKELFGEFAVLNFPDQV